jgi:hypothetical protein
MPTHTPKNKFHQPSRPVEPAQPSREDHALKSGGTGRSGSGAESALEHVIAQEKIRTRKPETH